MEGDCRLSDQELDDLHQRIKSRRLERTKLGLTDFIADEDEKLELALAELQERRNQAGVDREGREGSERVP